MKIEFIINFDLKDIPAFYDEREDTMTINLANPIYLLEDIIEDVLVVASLHETIHKVCPECREEEVRTLTSLAYNKMRYG